MCLISQVCANSDQLFRLLPDENFICQFKRTGFDELKRWLLNGSSHGLQLTAEYASLYQANRTWRLQGDYG